MELGRCKKHTSHKYSKGVCPYCLREKLAQVTASSASSTAHSSSSYGSDSSAGESPKHANRHRRTKTLLQLLNGGKAEPLGRSRSMAFPIGEKDPADREQSKSKKRSGRRFWPKILLGRGGRSKEGEEAGLYHSKTVKEKPSTKWDHLFSH